MVRQEKTGKKKNHTSERPERRQKVENLNFSIDGDKVDLKTGNSILPAVRVGTKNNKFLGTSKVTSNTLTRL